MTQQPTTEALVAEYLRLGEQITDLTTQQGTIRAQLRDRLDLGKHDTPVGTVTLSVNRRFDETTARAVLTQELAAGRLDPLDFQKASKTVLDASFIKKKVAPDVYESMMKIVGDPKVTVSA